MFALLPVKVAGLFYVRSQGAPFLTFACRKTKKQSVKGLLFRITTTQTQHNERSL